MRPHSGQSILYLTTGAAAWSTNVQYVLVHGPCETRLGFSTRRPERPIMTLLGEDLLSDDEQKQSRYPLASRAIVNLDTDSGPHIRAHLVNPTVMLVAATAAFTATLDRPRGVLLLRHLAGLLESQRLDEIPWGPKNPAHKPVLRALVDSEMDAARPPSHDDMPGLMAGLKAEFNTLVDTLIHRYEETQDGADETLLTGFLTQFMLQRWGTVEEVAIAWSLVRECAVDEGWIEPGAN